MPQAQNVPITLSILEPTSMTERPITVRQHFQALHDMATSSDKELTDDIAASLFASLDRVWISTHRERLTSHTFFDNLKIFLLIRGGIEPSSPAAVPVIAQVKALTRMRLRLLEERGSGDDRGKMHGGQVVSNLQQINTPAEATSSAGPERWGVSVSAVNMQTTRQTRSGWLAAIRANSRRHDEGRSNLCSCLVLSAATGAVESRDMSHQVSHRASRLQLLLSLISGWPLSSPLSLLDLKTTATVQGWLAFNNLTCACSTDLCCQDGTVKVEERSAHGARGFAPVDEEGPAAPTDLHMTLRSHARAVRLNRMVDGNHIQVQAH